MGKASSSKKVARAASIGGGARARSARPWMWWVVLGAVVVLGVAGIAFSRSDYRSANEGSNTVPPIANQDHWHAAYGVYVCDSFLPPITDDNDPKGIHTHSDGIIHIHPFFRSAAGENAVLNEFTAATDMTLTDSKLRLPGGELFEEGESECDGEPAIVQVKVDDRVVTNNIGRIKLEDRALMTIAFAPRGAEIPIPPTADDLDRLDPTTESILPDPSEIPTSTPPPEGETTVPPGEGEEPTTSAP